MFWPSLVQIQRAQHVYPPQRVTEGNRNGSVHDGSSIIFLRISSHRFGGLWEKDILSLLWGPSKRFNSFLLATAAVSTYKVETFLSWKQYTSLKKYLFVIQYLWYRKKDFAHELLYVVYVLHLFPSLSSALMLTGTGSRGNIWCRKISRQCNAVSSFFSSFASAMVTVYFV